MKLKSNGLDLDTVTCIGYKLPQLKRETDLNDPENVKAYMHRRPHEQQDKETTMDFQKKLSNS